MMYPLKGSKNEFLCLEIRLTLSTENLFPFISCYSLIDIELLFLHFFVANSLVHHAEILAPGDLDHD